MAIASSSSTSSLTSTTIIQSPSQQQPNDLRKLVEYLLSDLRTLSTEAKKKHNHVKESAESAIVKIRNISTNSHPKNLLENLRSACGEIIYPLILGCATKNPKLVQISLQSIQRMLQFKIIDANSSPVIVNELWHLTEAECEELRVLQTITPFVSSELLVTNTALAKCIVLAIKLNFSKDPSVINAASAAVRQLFSCVFERVLQEDSLNLEINTTINISENNNLLNTNSVPITLMPAAADGYLLLRDLILLIKKENPIWLIGVKRITITLALELLESILKLYPSIFNTHNEYADLLQNQICPQLIKIFVGEKDIKSINSGSEEDDYNNFNNDVITSSSPPIFPILMRALRIALVFLTNYHSLLISQNEVIISFLLKLIYTDGFIWQTAMALEIVHKILIQPNFLFWLCENYELRPNMTKLIRLILQSIISYIKKTFDEVSSNNVTQDGSQFFGQIGFYYKGIFIQLHENISLNKRWILLDWLEKHEPGPVPEGYCLSIAYMCLIDCTHSVYSAIEGRNQINNNENLINKTTNVDDVAKELHLSTYRYLLEGLSILLECSADNSISDAILNCFSTLTLLSCRVGTDESKDLALRTMAQFALPTGYFCKFIEGVVPQTQNNNNNNSANLKNNFKFNNGKEVINNIPNQIVATGISCPVSFLPSTPNTNVMFSLKNLQVARILIACAQQNGQQLTGCWDMVLTTFQHLVWILNMKPISATNFRTGNDSSAQTNSGNIISTTILSSELPDLSTSLNKLFESTINFDEVSLHHVVAALCRLSLEAMQVAQSNKEPSFFPVAKLLQTALVNLHRLEVFWKPVTAHLLEICAHSNANLREWGTNALTTLIKSAIKQVLTENNNVSFCEGDLAKIEHLILVPLASMNEIKFLDVSTKQLNCLMHILQSDSHQLKPQIWPSIINIVTSIVDNCNDSQLIEQGYRTMNLIVKEFLNILPFDCVRMLVETDSKYGKQKIDLNVSLSAVGQLWDISDYVRRESANRNDENEVENVWLVLYESLSHLCVDSRPPVRKSACDTMLQTVAAHGQALKTITWSQMIWKILFPMLDTVKFLTNKASTLPTNTAALGASNILIHHSRDTESKQWAETTVKTLSGVVKIFNSQRSILILLDDFSKYWIRLLDYIEYVSSADNSEMSLAALKNFQELLFGRQQQTDGREKQNLVQDPSIPQLSEKLWLVSWNFWLRIARLISSPTINYNLSPNKQTIQKQKTYIPGPFHLTTLLNIFILLFDRVGRHITVDEMYFNNVPSILRDIACIPPSDQVLFSESTENSELNLTQEYILDCIRIIFHEQLNINSSLKAAIPDILELLLNFVQFSIRPPSTKFVSILNNDNQFFNAKKNLIAFGELSLQMVVDYYLKVASFNEIIKHGTLIKIINCLLEPLSLKYHCPSQTTWKAAATSLVKVCQIGLPITREHPEAFTELWDNLANVFENFLFTTSKSEIPLNADERKQHEFVDCLIIELIRTQILPFSKMLPWNFMQKIIDILNRGSINTMDAKDIMASESFQHRADLSRVCFDALLSISRSGSENNVNSLNSDKKNAKSIVSTNSLGVSAITSLLSRCKEVLNNYAKDEQNSGNFRLPQERIFETISVLRAISTLIDEFIKYSKDSHSILYSNLVGIYLNLVQMIPSCKSDQQLELALMAALSSYQTLLLINIHKF